MSPQNLQNYQDKIEAGDIAKDAICGELYYIVKELNAMEVIARMHLKKEFPEYDNAYYSGRLFRFLSRVRSDVDPLYTHKDNQIHFCTYESYGDGDSHVYNSIPDTIFFAPNWETQKELMRTYVDSAAETMRQKLLNAREAKKNAELVEYEKLKVKYGN